MCSAACRSRQHRNARILESEEEGASRSSSGSCVAFFLMRTENMRAGCRLWFLVLAFACISLGCKRNDLLENELRERDNQYREALDELGRTEHRNHAMEREVDALRKGAPVTPEQAAQTFGLKR